MEGEFDYKEVSRRREIIEMEFDKKIEEHKDDELLIRILNVMRDSFIQIYCSDLM